MKSPSLKDWSMARWKTYRVCTMLAVALVMVLVVESLALACPTCKDSIDQSDPQRQNLMQGFYYSIIFMVSMPFLIFTGLCTYFYYEVCKARRQQRSKAMPAALSNALSQATATR